MSDYTEQHSMPPWDEQPTRNVVAERLARRNAELEAHIAQVEQAIENYMSVSSNYTEERTRKRRELYRVLELGPQQSLREIRAEAGREGYVYAITEHGRKSGVRWESILDGANEYAQQIREGKE